MTAIARAFHGSRSAGGLVPPRGRAARADGVGPARRDGCAARASLPAMPVYAVAELTVHDRERYDRYVAGFLPVIEQYGGRVLAAQDGPDVLEGSWPHDRIVLLAFDDRASFDRWSGSPEYGAIVEDRYGGADSVIVLAEGLQ